MTFPVEIDSKSIACRSFIGFGAEWDSRGYIQAGVTDKDFGVVRGRVRWMRLPVARIMMLTKWCYRGKGKYDWDSPDMKALYRHLDVCQELGTTVFLTDWGCERKWVAIPGIKDTADPNYAEAIGDYMDYLINRKGYTCIRHFILVNEPNNEVKDWDCWKKGVENVFAVFKKLKLDKKVLFTGSDATARWHQMAVDQLQHILGAYDIHRYARDRDVRAGKLRDYFHSSWEYALEKDPLAKNKPFIVGEAGMGDGAQHPRGNLNIGKFDYGVFMVDYAVQAANAGSSAVMAWMLDDNSHVGFFWGLWTNKEKGLKLRPWFYPWSLLSRYLPQGSVVYRVKDPGENLRVMAARAPKKGRDGGDGWTFCFVNRGDEDVVIVLTVPEGKSESMSRYVYSRDSAKADKDGFPVPLATEKYDFAKGIEVTCPANAVVLLTSVE